MGFSFGLFFLDPFISLPILERLDVLPRRPILAGKDGRHLLLAGAQVKLPVMADGHRIGLPHIK